MIKPKIKGDNLDNLEIPSDLWDKYLKENSCGECNDCEEEGDSYMSNECDQWSNFVTTIQESSGLYSAEWVQFLIDEFVNSNLDTNETTGTIEINGVKITATCMACKFGDDSHYWNSWMVFYKD